MLPQKEFEVAHWKICTMAYNYHISVDRMFYSVPYVYIKKKVDVRMTRTVAEVFLDSERIASHVRKYGHQGQYSTLPEHMPEDHHTPNGMPSDSSLGRGASATIPWRS